MEVAETAFVVRGLGYFRGIEDLENVPVRVRTTGTPVLLRDIATVSLGPELRRGVLELNGEGEAVGGIVVMRLGENALSTIQRIKERLKELQAGLPEGVEVVPVYDRSTLIENAIDTLKRKLTEEMIVVALVCLVFLLHMRSAFVALFTLPVGILMSFIVMHWMGLNANIMSLGGIAIAVGVMVDASVVMVENAHRHLRRSRESGEQVPHDVIMLRAATEVVPALFFSLLIITLSFLPIFALQAQEGRLFRPLAYTKTFAMAAAAILAITVIPVLMTVFIRGRIRPETSNPINRFFLWIYRPFLEICLHFPKTVILVAVMVLGGGPGVQVICPAHTFFATAGSIARLGAVPVFVDIDPVTYNMDPHRVRTVAQRCTRLRAIMPVHLFGQSADMEAFVGLGEEFGVPIIEDAAQALGSRDRQGHTLRRSRRQ